MNDGYRITDSGGVAFWVKDRNEAFARFFDMVNRTAGTGWYELRHPEGHVLCGLFYSEDVTVADHDGSGVRIE